MQEKPILFSTPMVQANLDGRKTNTRRTRGLEKINENPNDWQFEWGDYSCKLPFRFTQLSTVNEKTIADRSFHQEAVKCPHGQPGDVLWVRESFAEKLAFYKYKADFKDQDSVFNHSWKPSIHMPKAAARIWLQVEEIRVERLQDISEEDMIHEGILIPVSERNTPCFILGTANSAFSFLPDGCFADGATPPTKKQILFAYWAELWSKINGRESWDANPWVWVVKYKMLSTTGKPQMCYKTNEICKYDCKGLCRESM